MKERLRFLSSKLVFSCEYLVLLVDLDAKLLFAGYYSYSFVIFLLYFKKMFFEFKFKTSFVKGEFEKIMRRSYSTKLVANMATR